MRNFLSLLACIATLVAGLAMGPARKAPGTFIHLKPYDPQTYAGLEGSFGADMDARLDESFLNSLSAGERRAAVYSHYLRKHEILASDMRAYLINQLGVAEDDIEGFWMVNALFVKRMPENFVGDFHTMVAGHPHVSRVGDNEVVANIVSPVEEDRRSVRLTAEDLNVTWSLRTIGVDRVWDNLGITGEGVRIATIDTGVEVKHPALLPSYAGTMDKHDYAWFDPKEFANDEWWCDDYKSNGNCFPAECCLDAPFDIIGHGTHVQATIAGVPVKTDDIGTFAVGVAPGAKWMAAKGCVDGRCLKYGLLKSAEWVVCPTNLNGTEPNCNLGADIVSNSWGAQNPKELLFLEVVKVWREAGMIPVFANGNLGPSCGEISSPGDFKNVIGVGATTIDDQLAKFSSRGPGPVEEDPGTPFARQKPDFCAPGSKVISASYGRWPDKTLFTQMSGTSMATPHVSGVIALMLSASRRSSEKPMLVQQSMKIPDDATSASLSYDQIYKILSDTAERTKLKQPIGGGGRTFPLPGFPVRQKCEGTTYEDWPNMFYGYGRIDAYAAVKSVIDQSQ